MKILCCLKISGKVVLRFWMVICFFSCNWCKTEDDPQPILEDQSCGIYSEPLSANIIFDTTAYIGVYPLGGSAIFKYSDFIDDINDPIEGRFCKKATLSVNPSSNQNFAGWYIQAGNEISTETQTIDMSLYQGGMIMFWVKSFIKDFEIEIRSSDQSQTGGLSRVLASSYGYQNNGNWCHVCIPIADFQAMDQNLHLNHMKILFSIVSNKHSGGTNGEQTFWIDNIRWEFRIKTPYPDCK